MRRYVLPMMLVSCWMTSVAHAGGTEQEGMPLDHAERLRRGGVEDPLMGPMDAKNLEYGGKLATRHSRIEGEGKIAVPDEKNFTILSDSIARLADSQALAEKVIGRGWFVQHVRDADYGDTYMDDDKLFLLRHLSGLRDRRVNGTGRELNFKPPGGLQMGPDGMVLARAELGLPLGPNADIPAILRTRSNLHLIDELTHLYKGDLGKLAQPAIALQTKRGRFKLGMKDGPPKWDDLLDLSVDKVYGIRDVRPGAKAATGAVTPIYGLEGDLNHPGADTGLVIANVRWTSPHKSADAHREEFYQDAAVQAALLGAFPKIVHWMRDAHGMQFSAALPKATQGALNLGMLKANQLKLNARRR